MDAVPPRAGEPASGHGAAAGGRPGGPRAGQAPSGSAGGAWAVPHGGAHQGGWGKGGAVTRRAQAGLGARAQFCQGRGLGPEVGAAPRRLGDFWAAA